MNAQPHNFFLLRRPLLPLETIFDFKKTVGDNPATFEGEILKIFSKPLMMEALFLASPVLHGSLLQFLEGNYQSGQFKLCQSLYKYLIRMCSRCTPFGLFAGNVEGEVSDYTSIEFQEKSLEPFYSLDSTVLFSLRSYMSTVDHVRSQILFYPNTSLYLSNGSFRYLERPHFPDSNFMLVEAEANQYLNEILELSRRGIRIGQLVQFLVERGICLEDAHSFVDSIINAQILVSELDTTATGGSLLKSMIKTLESLKNCQEHISRLRQMKVELSSESFAASRPNQIKNLLSAYPLKLDPNKIVKADLRVNAECCSLGQAAIEIIKSELDDLSFLTAGQRNEELYQFAKDFFRKYQNKEMPLLMVIDQEIGIGYGNQQPIASDDFSLLEGVELPINEDKKQVNWSTLSLVSLKLYEQALSEAMTTVSLNAQDLSPYPPDARDTQHKVEGFYVMGSFLTDSVQNMDKGKFQFVHQATGGPSAFNLMSRFCNDNHILTGQVMQAISWEEFSDPDCIYAEINHIPNLKSGNVLIRPSLRKYEIPYLSSSSVKEENQIPPSDLWVSAKEDGEIILRSKRLGKRVYPRLTNAHNYENGLPVYRFLCDLARQGSEELFNWNWGFLSDRPFLPRVEYKHFIVSKATWNLDGTKLESFSSLAEWTGFRLKSKIPRYVQLAESDNLLLLDMESEFDVKILKEALAKNGKVRLVEYLETPGKGLFQSDGQHFANEVIIPFLAKPLKKIYKSVLVTQGFIKERKEFLPGSEWLYMKIQCAPKIANHLLINLIKPLCENLFKNNVIEKWFFVRYHDPENQIRIRFYNSCQPTFFMKILYEINLRIQPYIQNGSVVNVSVDTYARELERYQQVNYDLLESIFSAESTAILNVLSMQFKPKRWQVALQGADLLLENLGYSLNRKKEFAQTLANGFYNEFKTDQSFLVQLNNKYRSCRSEIEFIMDPDNGETSGLNLAMSYFSQRSELLGRIRPSAYVNESSRDHLAASLIHMFLNRLFNSSQRLQELIVYHYLKKYYDSMHSSGKMSKRFDKNVGSNLQVTDNSLI